MLTTRRSSQHLCHSSSKRCPHETFRRARPESRDAFMVHCASASASLRRHRQGACGASEKQPQGVRAGARQRSCLYPVSLPHQKTLAVLQRATAGARRAIYECANKICTQPNEHHHPSTRTRRCTSPLAQHHPQRSPTRSRIAALFCCKVRAHHQMTLKPLGNHPRKAFWSATQSKKRLQVLEDFGQVPKGVLDQRL